MIFIVVFTLFGTTIHHMCHTLPLIFESLIMCSSFIVSTNIFTDMCIRNTRSILPISKSYPCECLNAIFSLLGLKKKAIETKGRFFMNTIFQPIAMVLEPTSTKASFFWKNSLVVFFYIYDQLIGMDPYLYESF